MKRFDHFVKISIYRDSFDRSGTRSLSSAHARISNGNAVNLCLCGAHGVRTFPWEMNSNSVGIPAIR